MKVRFYVFCVLFFLTLDSMSAAIPKTNREFIPATSSQNTTFNAGERTFTRSQNATQNSDFIESDSQIIESNNTQNFKKPKKTKAQNAMLGFTYGIGVTFDMLSASGSWSGMRQFFSPYKAVPFTPSINSQSVGGVISVQYVWHNLHFLSDTRVSFSVNINKRDSMKFVMSADELSGYYFPFNGSSGLAIKMGATMIMASNGEKNDGSGDFDFINGYTSDVAMANGFFGFGSKIGLEYNIGPIAIGAFFSSYYLWFFLYDESLYKYTYSNGESGLPHNFNADKKSHPYNIHASVTFRF